MKKRVLYFTWLLSLVLITGCSKGEDAALETEKTPIEAEEDTTPPPPGEETWGTAPEFKASLITTTPIRYLSVTVGETEEDVNFTWYSPSEEAGAVYWTTIEDTEFAKAVTVEAKAYPSDITSGYYVNRVTVTGLLPETEYLYRVGNEEAMSPDYTYTTPAFSDTFRFTAVGDAQIGKPVEEVDKQKNNWHKLSVSRGPGKRF